MSVQTASTQNQPVSSFSIGRLWGWLTEPPEFVTGAERRTVRLLSSLLLSLVVLGIPLGFGQNVARLLRNEAGPAPSPVTAGAILLLVVAYFLSRTRFYRIGGGIIASITTLAIVASQFMPTANPATVGASMMYMSVGVIVASFLLRKRGIVAIWVLNILSIGLIKIINPEIDLVANFTSIGFNMLIPILALVAVQHRDRQEADRQAELHQLNADLSDSLEQARTATAALREANTALVSARKQAEEASRLKDEFLSVMSHELRTPLNAIMGYQGIMELMGTLDDENLEMVQRTQANARRLLELINDVLDISRIEAGRMEIVTDKLVLRDFITRIQAQMDVLAQNKELAFNVTVADSVPPVLYADEDALTKILVNLLSNAFKFTEQGHVDLNVRFEDGNTVIDVCDTGAGIPFYMHEIIFERFRQGDSSSTRKHGGSGLGLSIVQQLCQLMDGKIDLDSEPGRGSTFTVTLPLEAAAEREMVA